MSDRHDEPKTASPAGGQAAMSPETTSLLGLIDKLGSLLERSDLVEIEVEAGETGILLRKPAAIAPSPTLGVVATVATGAESSAGGAAASAAAAGAAAGLGADAVGATFIKILRVPLRQLETNLRVLVNRINHVAKHRPIKRSFVNAALQVFIARVICAYTHVESPLAPWA